MLVIALIIIFALGVIAFVLGLRLYYWEKQLQGARIVIAYKGRTKMNPRLIDWLLWSKQLDSDHRVNGQVVYRNGGTTIAIVKVPLRTHGKTTTTTVKEKAA